MYFNWTGSTKVQACVLFCMYVGLHPETYLISDQHSQLDLTALCVF